MSLGLTLYSLLGFAGAGVSVLVVALAWRHRARRAQRKGWRPSTDGR